ncbi:MAG: hypothetical protein HDT35_02330 [Clostridiales bacterium]|nr:hypothetical protein [Clostridiales bacterium]
MKQVFRELKRNSPREDLTAHIIFTEDSFARLYPLLSRTYSVSSDNKAFWPSMGGYSVFAYCLDKVSDQGIRLDWYMAEEGNAGGWKVEDCYILERMRDAAAIPNLTRTEQEDETLCYFFGDTCIRVRETMDSGKGVLTPETFDYGKAQIGDYVDQGVVDDATDCVPPVCMTSECAQMGERGQHMGVRGHCFYAETEEQGRDPVYVGSGDARHYNNLRLFCPSLNFGSSGPSKS